MRIAQIAPLVEAIPPRLYGGTERVIHWLTEELVALGHEVTLFASGDSSTSAKLEPGWPRALRFESSVHDQNALHMLMLEHVCQKAAEFDVLHFHLDYYPFSLFARQRTPFVTTMHGRLDLPEHDKVMNGFRSVPIVSISDAQREPVPDAGWIRTIHHGLPAGSLKPMPMPRSYLAVLGRISPEKGMDGAVRIAEQCGLPLKIAAKIDRVDVEYFQTTIRPLLRPPQIEHIGEIGDAQKSEFLSGAIALLAPLDWPEPFGLVLIEAMACGTPVIAYDRGAVSEIVEDGVTGFIVNDEAGAVAALEKVPHLSAAAIRRRFEERFTARRMANDYLAVYAELIEAAMPRPKLVRVFGGKA